GGGAADRVACGSVDLGSGRYAGKSDGQPVVGPPGRHRVPAERLLLFRLLKPAVELLTGDISVLDHDAPESGGREAGHDQVHDNDHAEEAGDDRDRKSTRLKSSHVKTA